MIFGGAQFGENGIHGLRFENDAGPQANRAVDCEASGDTPPLVKSSREG
jgi:hypothetical protein